MIFGDSCRFFQNVAEFSLKSHFFRWKFRWFLSEFQGIVDIMICGKSLSFASISRNSRENGAYVHQFWSILMNKFINYSSKNGDELLFISNLALNKWNIAPHPRSPRPRRPRRAAPGARRAPPCARARSCSWSGASRWRRRTWTCAREPSPASVKLNA